MMNLNVKDNHLNKNSILIEKILKSNKAILETLTKNIPGLGLDFKKQIINSPIFIEKMSLLFNYYTKKENIDLTTFKTKLSENHGIKITPVIETMLINLAENLSLSYFVIYELMENFNKENSEYLKDIYYKEEFYNTFTANISQPSDPKFMMFKQKYEQIQTNFQNEIIKEYFSERTLLIQISILLVNIVNQKNHVLNEDCVKLFKKIYPKEKEFIKVMTDLFVSYTKDFKLQKIFDTISSKEIHSLTLIREQTLLLENILNYSICIDICSSPSYLILFENLIKTNFNGYLNYELSEPCSEETRALYLLYAQTLSNLSFLFIVNTINMAAIFPEKSCLNYKIYDQNFQEISNTFLFFNEKNLEFLKKYIYKTEQQERISFVEEGSEEFYGYSYFNKIILFIFYYVIKSIESTENAIKEKEIYKNNEALIKNLKLKIEKHFISFKELKESNIENNYFTLTINYLISLFDREILSHEKYGYHIQYRSIITQVANLIIKEKYLENEDEMLPSKNNDLKKIVDLIEKIYDNPSVLRNLWSTKDLNKEPILNLLFKFINQFPINIDLLLRMYFCLLKYKDNFNSNNILEILLDMRFYTCSCYEEELEILEDEEIIEELKDKKNKIEMEIKDKPEKDNSKKVRLLNDKLNEIIKIPMGQIGKTYDDGKIKLVTFFIRYSIYDFLFLKWDTVNEYISQLNTYANLNNVNVSNTLDEYHFTCSEYLRLFCDFISNSDENIDLYISSKYTDIITTKAASEEYNKIISAAFDTLYLVGNNKGLYYSLHNFIKSIYKMIYILIKKTDSSLVFMNIFVSKFIDFSPTDVGQYDLGYSSTPQQPYYMQSGHRIGSYRINSVERSKLSIPNIFFNNIFFDNHYKNFDNTLIILKICKLFFKGPIIFEFVKSLNCIEFLEILWGKVISELAKLFYDFESIKEEQIKILNQIISIINELLNLITYSANKTQLISTDNVNNFERLLVFCLNQVETLKLILPILKTDIQIERELNYQNVILENYLEKTSVREKIGFIEHKKNIRKLIRNALRCLNLIFNNLISYKNITTKQNYKIGYQNATNVKGYDAKYFLEDSEDILKIYQALDFIKIWNDIFYISKTFISNEIRQGNNVYTINLINSLFSYFQYEIEKNYPFEYADTIIFFGLKDSNKLEKYLIDYRNYDDKYFNVGEIAVSALNKIIVLLKFGSMNQLGNIASSGPNKAINILNYLYVKKENSTEVDSSINLFENLKDMIFGLLSTDSSSLKNQILQFLILVSNSQQGFISLLMDESKTRSTKYKFWDVFFKLSEWEKTRIKDLDDNFKSDENIFISKKEFYKKEFKKIISYLTIFLSNILSKELIFKKAIKELISNYSKQLETFLNDVVHNLKDCKREIFKGSVEEIEIQQIEEGYNLNLLELTTMKSLSIIFSKIIFISDSKYFNIRLDKISQIIQFFFEKNIVNFLTGYDLNVDYSFLNEFNRYLHSPESKENSSLFAEGEMGILKPGFGISNYQEELAMKNSIINIKNFMKTLNISDDEYFYGCLNSLDNISYSFNYWIDLKELYISMKTKNYNMLIFFEFFDKLFEYNFSVCLAEANVNALTSISHFIGIICSIGFNNTISSTYLFSDNYTLKLANSTEKKLAEDIMLKDKDTFIKVNFDILNNLYGSKLDNFLRFCESYLLNAVAGEGLLSRNTIESKNQGKFGLRPSEKNPIYFDNFYGQYYSYKYDILFYLLENLKTLYNIKADSIFDENSLGKTNLKSANLVNLSKIPTIIKEEEETLNISYGKIHEFLIEKTLLNLVEELNLYVRSDSSEETEKCIFSIINLIHSIFTFLVVTGYQLNKEEDLIIMNTLINSLMSSFNSLHNYSNTVILIICSYMNLTNSQENFIENEKIIGNYIPLLESNRGNGEEYTFIRIIMRKLKPDISNTNFLILLQFLNLFVKSYGINAIEVILKEKILLAIILNDPFENSFALNEYEDNERGTKHILWCWIWNLFKTILLSISENDSNIYNPIYSLIIEFILNHEKRVYNVLSNSDYTDKSGNTLQKSLAFVEELESITHVLNLLFLESNKWKNNFYEFYMRTSLTIIEKSIKLYIPNVKISNHFKCFSNYEHRMNEVTHSHLESTSLYKENEALSIFSPLKLTKSIGSKYEASKYDKTKQSLNYFGFNPTIFYYRIDCSLITILFNLTNIIKKVLLSENESNQYMFINYVLENSKPSKIKIIEDHCQNLIYTYYYAIHSFDTNIKNFDTLKNLWTKSQVFFKNIISSSNLGAFNLSYLDGEFKDFYFLNAFAIQNILTINLTYNNILYDSRMTYEYNFPNQLKDITYKKLDNIRNMLKLIESDSKIPEFKNYSKSIESLFKSVKQSFEIK